MNLKKPTKIPDDHRYKYVKWYFIIAIILLLTLLVLFSFICVKQEWVDLCLKILWCLAFTLLGFSLLVLKIRINSIKMVNKDEKEMTDDEKVKLKEEKKKEEEEISAMYEKEKRAKEKKEQKEKDDKLLSEEKDRLRYTKFYPLFIGILTLLSAAISINKFGYCKIQFLIVSAFLSFFLGFFIDSISNVIEKVGKFLSG